MTAREVDRLKSHDRVIVKPADLGTFLVGKVGQKYREGYYEVTLVVHCSQLVAEGER